MKNTSSTQQQTGFTLAELMIAVAIMGILLTISAPQWSSFLSNLRLKGDTRELFANLQKAKLQAGKENTCLGISYLTVAFPATGGGYSIFRDDGAGGSTRCNKVRDGAETNLLSITMSQGNALVNVSAGLSPMCYNQQAVICGSQQGNLQLRNQSRWYKITVSPAGNLQTNTSSDGTTWN